MSSLRLFSSETPVGAFHIIVDEENVAVASGFGNPEFLAMRLPDELRVVRLEVVDKHPYQERVAAYFKGDPEAFSSVAARHYGSGFTLSSWEAMNGIRFGERVSYSDLAALAGNPSAVRAAGTACGANRLILLVPCHRIVKTDGSLGNYLYGTEIKKFLLDHEEAFS